jgi:hypothetical protein
LWKRRNMRLTLMPLSVLPATCSAKSPIERRTSPSQRVLIGARPQGLSLTKAVLLSEDLKTRALTKRIEKCLCKI